ncbi:MAG: TIGR01440 family protein [Streptococcaceae bacterium]|nr:TIGR01440 family protein [Streptococcaceae bacterium]
MSMEQIKIDTKLIMEDILKKSGITKGEIFVVGLSSSEVIGGVIGKNSSRQTGQVIMRVIHEMLSERGIFLATQGCEHLNRALVVERELAIQKDLEIVDVVPAFHAGGSGQVATWELMSDPVEVEHIVAKAGIDIGDVSIGMHIKHVAIPIRPVQKELGYAHVTALTSRPKKIGGARAVSEWLEN